MSDKVLTVEIVTPQRTVYSGNAAGVTVPGTKGGFQVLYNHAPIVSSLGIGIIKINDGAADTIYATDGGFVEVLHNKVSVLVETAERADEIDIAAIKQQREQLAERLENTTAFHERDAIKHDMDRLANRLRAATGE